MFSSLVEASLLSAAKSGHHKVVALILRGSNVNVNVEDGEGDTPLTSASLRGHREVVNLLLKEKGIEVKVENYIDVTFQFTLTSNNWSTFASTSGSQKMAMVGRSTNPVEMRAT